MPHSHHSAWPILVLGKMLPPPSLRSEVELRSRAQAAALLYAQSPCPILTFEAPLAMQPQSGSALVVHSLVEAGVPCSAIVQRKQSTSTAEELHLAELWLQHHSHFGLRVITSGYHIPRVSHKLRRFPWPSIVFSPEMIATCDSNTRFSLGFAQTGAAALRWEQKEERKWFLGELIAGLLPKTASQQFEITAGQWWRRKWV